MTFEANRSILRSHEKWTDSLGASVKGPHIVIFLIISSLILGGVLILPLLRAPEMQGQAAQVMEQKFRESLVSNAVSLPIKPENFRFTLSGSLLQVQVSGVQVLSPEGQAELKVQITEAIQKVLGLSFSGSTSTKIEISLQ